MRNTHAESAEAAEQDTKKDALAPRPLCEENTIGENSMCVLSKYAKTFIKEHLTKK